jgi:hypothetical protein
MVSESMARLMATVLTFVGVPVLTVLSYRAWVIRTRVGLPHWRNGIGLTALVLISLSWLWYALWYVLTGTRFASQLATVWSEFTFMSALCTQLATVFAMAWKGTSRLQAIAAGVLMLLGFRFFSYV